MNETETETLKRRLSRLETENRRVRLVALPLAILAAAVVLSVGMAEPSAQQSGTERLLEAERFVLKDKQGRVRAWLGIDDNDSATLRLMVIVRRILRAWRLGQSYRAIAAKLTADGVPTKQGGQWHHSTIGKVVARREYYETTLGPF